MAQIPEIKPDVNKEPEDKKKPGFLLRLFGGGGAAGEGGLGALGGGGGFGGAAAGGGLLATKAGILTLALVGTTVAGGIGVVGYKLFGPTPSDQMSGGNLSLFAPKPKQAPQPVEPPVAADGSSQSLTMLRKGNGDLRERSAASAAPADQTAADAAASGAAS
ncbi:MAG: hypothetical protein KGM24_00535, partial [Elusimicrobia bacterium]|nr:hypothetical protein [Elusimicrobiota bacterium]